jgi:hypothetical protein
MKTIKIHNIETDEIIEREMNAQELANWEKGKAESDFEEQKKQETAAAKAALLEKLGITEDEAKLLLS